MCSMALNGTADLTFSKYPKEKLTTKEKSRIRKPTVEKMRRDRINLRIIQLRKLLEQDFQLLQPGSKPEKADVLETAVQFLKSQICRFSNEKKAERSNYPEYNIGYSNCLNEVLSFLSTHRFQEQTQLHLLNYFRHLGSHPGHHSLPRRTTTSSTHDKNQDFPCMGNETFWRPW